MRYVSACLCLLVGCQKERARTDRSDLAKPTTEQTFAADTGWRYSMIHDTWVRTQFGIEEPPRSAHDPIPPDQFTSLAPKGGRELCKFGHKRGKHLSVKLDRLEEEDLQCLFDSGVTHLALSHFPADPRVRLSLRRFKRTKFSLGIMSTEELELVERYLSREQVVALTLYGQKQDLSQLQRWSSLKYLQLAAGDHLNFNEICTLPSLEALLISRWNNQDLNQCRLVHLSIEGGILDDIDDKLPATLNSLTLTFTTLDEETLASIARLPNLRSLEGFAIRFPDRYVQTLAQAKKLRVFRLHVREVPATMIAQLETLETIIIGAASLSAQHRRFLRANTNLRAIEFFGTELSDDDIEILTAMPRLTILRCTFCAAPALKGLVKSQSLKHISIYGPKIDVTAIGSVLQESSLRSLGLYDHKSVSIQELIRLREANPNVQILSNMSWPES